MTPVKFWLGWMKIIVIALMMLGIMALFFSDSLLMVIFNAPVEKIFINMIGNSPELNRLVRMFEGIIGSMLIAWTVLMYYVINNALKKGELWAWNGLFISVIIWFILHTGVLVYFRMNGMIIINIIIFLQAIAPLLILRSSIMKIKKASKP